MKYFDRFLKSKKDNSFPPVPKWKPNIPTNLDSVLEKARSYTEDKLQLAVFENGTVVFFSNKVDNIKMKALEVLDQIYNSHPDFKPISMDDGNILVEYSQPSFTIVFKSEIETNWTYIEENHKDGVCKAEVLINSRNERNVFDNIGKICLYGRAKMFMDAQAPNVVKIFDPGNL
jgi:hypothetical protein